MITASMRNWLDGKDDDRSGGGTGGGTAAAATTRETTRTTGTTESDVAAIGAKDTNQGNNEIKGDKLDLNRPRKKGERVVVVHCKAGKGRSGTSICSYLISECGWTLSDALARFTERRMRPNFGKGVSIPSQLRYVGYVDRWANSGKTKKKVYVDRPIEIVEIHVWGLRHGVKLAVEGFADEGKRIETLHTFGKGERIVVQGDAPGGGGLMDMFYDMAGYGGAGNGKESDSSEEENDKEEVNKQVSTGLDGTKSDVDDVVGVTRRSRSKEKTGKMGSRASSLMRKISVRRSKSKDSKEKDLEQKKSALSGGGSSATSSEGSIPKLGETNNNTKAGKTANGGKAKTIAMPEASKVTKLPSTEQNTVVSESTFNLTPTRSKTSIEQQKPVLADDSEPGGQAVIFKPKKPIIVPNSDINIDIERRSRASASMSLTMVTSVGHVWFNAFFEGNGPEQDGKADESGVFEIEWDKLDGIKGSSRKGTRALDRLSVVWRVAGTGTAATETAAAGGYAGAVAREGEQTTGTPAAAAAAGAAAGGVGSTPPPETVITQPGDKSPVPQMKPADWKGVDAEHLPKEKELGLRAETAESASVSKASSLKDLDITDNGDGDGKGNDDESLAGVKTSDPKGEELDEAATPKA